MIHVYLSESETWPKAGHVLQPRQPERQPHSDCQFGGAPGYREGCCGMDYSGKMARLIDETP